MKRFICCLLAVAFVFSLSGCCLKHEWKDATCGEPQTCTKCGATKGEPTGKHKWNDATCEEPKTCSVCGQTKGEPLGHEESDWQLESIDVKNLKKTMVKVCEECGEELDSKTEPLDSFIDGNTFAFTAKEFVERLDAAFYEQNGTDLMLNFSYAVNSYDQVNFDITNRNDVWLGWGLFYGEDDRGLSGDNEDGKITCVAIFVPQIEGLDLDTEFYLFGLLTKAAAQAIDPQITDISVYADNITNNVYVSSNGKDLHGLTYSCGLDTDDGNEFSLFIRIAE